MTEEPGLSGLDGDFDGTLELKTLKGRIMADIEEKLSQKEESLWRRGQVEIRKLQLEQQQVTSCINKMQERQAALMTENQKIRGVLLEVTSKFELVVKEMREVLRAMPQRSGGERLSPSPSVASTSASEVARDDHSFEQPSDPPSTIMTTEPSGAWSIDRTRRQAQTPLTQTPVTQTPVAHTPVPMWHTRGHGEGLTELPWRDEELSGIGDSKTFCTPPRATSSNEVVAPPPPASWRVVPASPAPAVLSLASALPSASLTPNPSPGLKRLHLAEHLEQQAAASSAPSSLTAVMVTPPNHMGHCEPASMMGHAARAAMQQFFSVDMVKEPGFVTLGIEVYQVDGSLRIDKIDEHGLVGRHNLRQESETNKVHIGDHIIEANGIRHDPNRMLHECKVRQHLTFTLARGGGASGAEKASSGWEVAGLIDPNEESGLSVSEEAVAVVAAADVAKVSSPLPTRLRPEASVFVPSAQKEGPLAIPPGLERYDVLGLMSPDGSLFTAALEPTLKGGDLAAVAFPNDPEEVKRALFP